MTKAEPQTAQPSWAASSIDGAFRSCVHRGTQQIGGTCIELSCDGARILVDLGLPLEADDTDPITLLPAVSGLLTPDPSLLALVLSHEARRPLGSGSVSGTGPADQER